MAASAVLLKIGQNIKKFELAHSAILNIAISALVLIIPNFNFHHFAIWRSAR